MEIIDLNEKYLQDFFCCLEDWSEEMKEAGDHKETWYHKMKEKGLGVKIALVEDKPVGMIQYIPVEYSSIEGQDLYFINCIWVHGHKPGVGNHQHKGIGKALLQAAEEDIRRRGKKGVAAWGIALPFWMRAAWFKKQGYRKTDKSGIAVLLWKPFSADAEPPHWIKKKKKPGKVKGKVAVYSFVNGWCPSCNIVHERAKRIAAEFGDKVLFQEINTFDRSVCLEWGISDNLFIDGKLISNGPPLSADKIRNIIARRVKKLNT